MWCDDDERDRIFARKMTSFRFPQGFCALGLGLRVRGNTFSVKRPFGQVDETRYHIVDYSKFEEDF